MITIIFSVVAYWLVNFRSGADTFFTLVMWLFLDLLAAESLVVMIASLFPNFVVALALTAFTNGIWMSVGGFMVAPAILNVFWRYVFHYIDYQVCICFCSFHPTNKEKGTEKAGKEENIAQLANEFRPLDVCIPRDDGERVFWPCLRLRQVVSVHVRQRACVSVPDIRKGYSELIRICHRQAVTMGRNPHFYHCSVSDPGMDRPVHEEDLSGCGCCVMPCSGCYRVV